MKMKPENTHKSEFYSVINSDDYKLYLITYLTLLISIFSSRIMDIQAQMTERCLELLLLPEDTPCLLLDIGCGSGLSGAVLEESGHMWIGMDISPAMLGN